MSESGEGRWDVYVIWMCGCVVGCGSVVSLIWCRCISTVFIGILVYGLCWVGFRWFSRPGIRLNNKNWSCVLCTRVLCTHLLIFIFISRKGFSRPLDVSVRLDHAKQILLVIRLSSKSQTSDLHHVIHNGKIIHLHVKIHHVVLPDRILSEYLYLQTKLLNQRFPFFISDHRRSSYQIPVQWFSHNMFQITCFKWEYTLGTKARFDRRRSLICCSLMFDPREILPNGKWRNIEMKLLLENMLCGMSIMSRWSEGWILFGALS